MTTMHARHPRRTEDLSDLAYSHVRDQLFTGGLKAGDKISESTLARRFKISRTPVRAAIRRLEVEGLVICVPRRGTYVSPPNRARLIETCQVRLAIEGFAAFMAASTVTLETLRELWRHCDNMRRAAHDFRDSKEQFMRGENLKRFLTNDLAFHVVLLKTVGNRRFMKLFMDGRIDTIMFGTHTHDRTLSHISRVWLMHHRIYMALRRRDGQTARHWMEVHISDSMQVALAQFDRNEQSGQPPYLSSHDDTDMTVHSLLRNMLQQSGSKKKTSEKEQE